MPFFKNSVQKYILKKERPFAQFTREEPVSFQFYESQIYEIDAEGALDDTLVGKSTENKKGGRCVLFEMFKKIKVKVAYWGALCSCVCDTSGDLLAVVTL